MKLCVSNATNAFKSHIDGVDTIYMGSKTLALFNNNNAKGLIPKYWVNHMNQYISSNGCSHEFFFTIHSDFLPSYSMSRFFISFSTVTSKSSSVFFVLLISPPSSNFYLPYQFANTPSLHMLKTFQTILFHLFFNICNF